MGFVSFSTCKPKLAWESVFQELCFLFRPFQTNHGRSMEKSCLHYFMEKSSWWITPAILNWTSSSYQPRVDMTGGSDRRSAGLVASHCESVAAPPPTRKATVGGRLSSYQWSYHVYYCNYFWFVTPPPHGRYGRGFTWLYDPKWWSLSIVNSQHERRVFCCARSKSLSPRPSASSFSDPPSSGIQSTWSKHW